MDTLVAALGPAFVLALAIQQLTEAVRSLLDWRNPPPDNESEAEKKRREARTRFVVGLIAFLVGLVAASVFEHVRVLSAFPEGASVAVWLDVLVTGLVVSGGTEGLNSILKFLGYTKEKKENEAEALKAQADYTRATMPS